MELLEDRQMLSVTPAEYGIDDIREIIAPRMNTVDFVTVVTHGFQFSDSGGDSLYSLANAIRQTSTDAYDLMATALGRTQYATWLLDYDVSGHGGEAYFDGVKPGGSVFDASGPTPNHIVLLFDWAPESDQYSEGWSEAAGDALFSLLVGTGLVDVTRGLNNPSYHFISHSYGTAVTSEAIERLAHYSVPVSQLTYLDPHDFDQGIILPIDGHRKNWTLGKPSWSGSPDGYGATVWNNVLYADTYYQTEFAPDGRPIPGAYNRLVNDNVTAPLSHSEVWSKFYLDSVSLGSDYGWAYSPFMQAKWPDLHGGQSAPAMPEPNFYDTLVNGTVQDHEWSSRNLLGLTGAARDEMQTKRWAPDPPALVFNGDFRFLGDETPLGYRGPYPGWTNHAGGTTSAYLDNWVDIAGAVGGPNLDNHYLRINPLTVFVGSDDRAIAIHNPVYLPPSTVGVRFDFRAQKNQLEGDLTTDDRLIIRVGETIIEDIPLSLYVVNRGMGGWKLGHSSMIPTPALFLRNTAATLSFEIIAGANKEFECLVDIDNVSLRTASATTGLAGIISAFNDGLAGVRQGGQIGRTVASGLGADLPVLEETVADIVDAVDRFTEPFTKIVEDVPSKDDLQRQLEGLGFRVDHIADVSSAQSTSLKTSSSLSATSSSDLTTSSLEPGPDDLLLVSWERTWNETGTKLLDFGFNTGFEYFDRGVDGEFSGSLSATLQPVTLSLTLGVDLVDGLPTFFVHEDSSLTVGGVSVTGSVGTNMAIRNLLDVDIAGPVTGTLAGALRFTDPDDDDRLRVGQFANPGSIVSSTLGGSISFTPSLTANLPIIGDLTWSGEFSATIDNRGVTIHEKLNAPSVGDVQGLLRAGYESIVKPLNLLEGIGLGDGLPVVDKSLGEVLGLPAFLTGGGLGGSGFSLNVTPETVSDLINGRTVDLIRFQSSGGDRYSKNFPVPIAAAAVPLGPVPLTFSLSFNTQVSAGWNYYVGLGVDTVGFYIDPQTAISASGSIQAGLAANVSLFGVVGVEVSAGVGAGVSMAVGFEDPDPRDGKIYLDELVSLGAGSLGSGIFDAIAARVGGEAYGYARGVAYIDLWLFTIDWEIFSERFTIASFGDTLSDSNRGSTPNLSSQRRSTGRAPLGTGEIPNDALFLTSDGVLTVETRTGLNRDSQNIVSISDIGDGQLEVQWRGVGVRTLAASSVSSIVYEGNDLSDRFFVGPNITAPVTARGRGSDDVLTVTDAAATIDGGGGNDLLRGSSTGDQIQGGDGDDRIEGRGGNDTLSGNAGDDQIDGGDGEDSIYGGDGMDILEGGAGNDPMLDGGAGDDQVFGGAGNDILKGGIDRDMLFGQADNDTLYGDDGDDVLVGGAGDDHAFGGEGNDMLYGDRGYAATRGGSDGNDFLFGQAGDDQLFGEGGDDEMYGDDEGQAYDDVLVGDAGRDKLYGRDGNDFLFGGDDPDELWGGNGDDTLTGGKGADVLQGEAGDDTLRIDFASADGTEDSMHGGLDRDRIAVSGGLVYVDMLDENGNPIIDPSTGTPRKILSDDVDDFIQVVQDLVAPNRFHARNITRDSATDSAVHTHLDSSDPRILQEFSFSFDVSDDTDIEELAIEGLGGDDRLEMITAENDGKNVILSGGTGDDILLGGSGRDTLRGGAGNDVLFGFSGDDALYGEEGRDRLDGGADNDALYAGPGGDGDYITGGLGREVIEGGAGDDFLVAGAGYYGSIINGGAGRDTIIGSEGRDLLSGGPGNDLILGGGMGDVINGGGGDDVLIGEEGRDVISGGNGDREDHETDNDTIYTHINNDYRLSVGLQAVPELSQEERASLWDTFDSKELIIKPRYLILRNKYNRGSLTDAETSEYADISDTYAVILEAKLDLIDFQTIYIDTAYGGDGHDKLYGGPLLDFLAGGPGDDWLFGSSTRPDLGGIFNESKDINRFQRGDIIDGGVDKDTLWFLGTDQDDVITIVLTDVDGAANRYVGVDLDGNGTVDGILDEVTTVESVGVRGLFGDDTITINLGNQFPAGILVDGGPGADRIDARRFQGKAELRGGAGNDVIFGGDNDDVLHGGGGDDFLAGGPGADIIYGDDGADKLFGDAGDDKLYGGPGDDELFGDSPDSTPRITTTRNELNGGGGQDELWPGAGNDVLFGGPSADEVIRPLDDEGRPLSVSTTVVNDWTRDTFPFEGGLLAPPPGDIVQQDLYVKPANPTSLFTSGWGDASTSTDNATVMKLLPNGNMVVVWEEYDAANGYDIYFAIYDPQGLAVLEPGRVNQSTVRDQRNPDLDIADDGTIVVVWDWHHSGNDHRSVWARQFDQTGSPLSNETRISATYDESRYIPLKWSNPKVEWATHYDLDNEGSVVRTDRFIVAFKFAQGGVGGFAYQERIEYTVLGRDFTKIIADIDERPPEFRGIYTISAGTAGYMVHDIQLFPAARNETASTVGLVWSVGSELLLSYVGTNTGLAHNSRNEPYTLVSTAGSGASIRNAHLAAQPRLNDGVFGADDPLLGVTWVTDSSDGSYVSTRHYGQDNIFFGESDRIWNGGPPITVAAGAAGEFRRASGGFVWNEGLVVTYEQNDRSGSGWDILGQRIELQYGSRIGTPWRIHEARDLNQYSPTLATTGHGQITVGWFSDVTNNARDTFRTAHYDFTNLPIVDEVSIWVNGYGSDGSVASVIRVEFSKQLDLGDAEHREAFRIVSDATGIELPVFGVTWNTELPDIIGPGITDRSVAYVIVSEALLPGSYTVLVTGDIGGDIDGNGDGVGGDAFEGQVALTPPPQPQSTRLVARLAAEDHSTERPMHIVNVASGTMLFATSSELGATEGISYLFIPLGAPADSVPANWRRVDNGLLTADAPFAAIAVGERIVATWWESEGGQGPSRIMGRVFGEAGEPIAEPFLITEFPINDPPITSFPNGQVRAIDLATNRRNDIAVAFQIESSAGDTTLSQVGFQAFDSTFQPLGEAHFADTFDHFWENRHYATTPRIAIGDDRLVLVGWKDETQSPPLEPGQIPGALQAGTIYGRAFGWRDAKETGEAQGFWAGQFRSVFYIANDPQNPVGTFDLAFVRLGRVMIAVTDHHVIQTRFADFDGMSSWNLISEGFGMREFRDAEGEAWSVAEPKIHTDGSGNVFFLFRATEASGARAAKLLWFDAGDGRWKGPDDLFESDLPSAAFLSLDGLQSGETAAVWAIQESDGSVGVYQRVVTESSPTVSNVEIGSDRRSIVVAFSQEMAAFGVGSVTDPANWRIRLPDGRFIVQRTASLPPEVDFKATPEQIQSINFGLNEATGRWEAVITISKLGEPDFVFTPAPARAGGADGKLEVMARRSMTDSSGRPIMPSPQTNEADEQPVAQSFSTQSTGDPQVQSFTSVRTVSGDDSSRVKAASAISSASSTLNYLVDRDTPILLAALDIPNVSPTAIFLSNNTVRENFVDEDSNGNGRLDVGEDRDGDGVLSLQGTVGVLSTDDRDPGNTFTYELVAGPGDDDNSRFTVSGNRLLTVAPLNFEADVSHSVRVRVTDQGGLSFEQVFSITVTDVPEGMKETEQGFVYVVNPDSPTGRSLISYSGKLLKKVFLGRWELLGADVNAGTAVLARDTASGATHRFLASDTWALVNLFDGIGSANTTQIPRSARGENFPADPDTPETAPAVRVPLVVGDDIVLSRDADGKLYADSVALQTTAGRVTIHSENLRQQAAAPGGRFSYRPVAVDYVDGQIRVRFMNAGQRRVDWFFNDAGINTSIGDVLEPMDLGRILNWRDPTILPIVPDVRLYRDPAGNLYADDVPLQFGAFNVGQAEATLGVRAVAAARVNIDYQVLFSGSGRSLTVTFDQTGQYKANNIYPDPVNPPADDSELFELEERFSIDLNGDGQIGRPGIAS